MFPVVENKENVTKTNKFKTFHLNSVLEEALFRRFTELYFKVCQEVVRVHGIQPMKKHVHCDMKVKKVHFRCIAWEGKMVKKML